MKGLSVTVIHNTESYSADNDFVAIFKDPGTQKIIRENGYSPSDVLGRVLLLIWKYGYTIDTIKTKGYSTKAYLDRYLGK